MNLHERAFRACQWVPELLPQEDTRVAYRTPPARPLHVPDYDTLYHELFGHLPILEVDCGEDEELE